MRVLTKTLVSTLAAGALLVAPASAQNYQAPPMTSTGSSFEQELDFLQGITGLRASLLGTYEMVDCTTCPLPQQIACHGFDAVGPALSFVFFGTSS